MLQANLAFGKYWRKNVRYFSGHFIFQRTKNGNVNKMLRHKEPVFPRNLLGRLKGNAFEQFDKNVRLQLTIYLIGL